MPELDPIKLHLQGFNYSGGWSDGAVIRKTYVGDFLASEVGEAVLTAASSGEVFNLLFTDNGDGTWSAG